MKRVTVFDFDGTLTRHGTLIAYARHALGRGAVCRAVIRTLPLLTAWKLGIIHRGVARNRLIRNLFRGRSVEELQASAESFADVLDRDLRECGMTELSAARDRGDIVVIDTVSMDLWVRPWARKHGVDHVIASRLESDAGGVLTGQLEGAANHGREKVRRLLEEFPDRQSYFLRAYGDSMGDKEMLELADEPKLLKRYPLKDKVIMFGFIVVTLLLALATVIAYNRYITSPPYVSPERFPVRGIDISAHNGDVNLQEAARAGMSFVWIKATEGTTWRDPLFALNYMKAERAGLARGAYHYFRFDCDGIEQALNLLHTIKARPLELGVAIDVEDHGNAQGIPVDTIIQRLRDMTEMLNMNGYRPVFYTNETGYEKYLYPEFRGMPLWLCSFKEETADGEWLYWQYDHRGSVPGIRGDVDLDAFNGSRDDWAEHRRHLRF